MEGSEFVNDKMVVDGGMAGIVGGWACGGRSSGCTWLNFVVESGCCCRWLKLYVFGVVVDAGG